MNVFRLTMISLFALTIAVFPAKAEVNWDLFKLGPNRQATEVDDVMGRDKGSTLFQTPQLAGTENAFQTEPSLFQRWNAALKKLALKTSNTISKPFHRNTSKLTLSEGNRGQVKKVGFWERLTTSPQDPQKPQTLTEWLGQPMPQ